MVELRWASLLLLPGNRLDMKYRNSEQARKRDSAINGLFRVFTHDEQTRKPADLNAVSKSGKL